MSQSPFLMLRRFLVFSPLGLSLVDDLTGGRPVGAVRPTLEVRVGKAVNVPPAKDDVWQPTGIRGLFTDSGILAYPNLGRRDKGKKLYRVKIDAQYYVPLYHGWPGREGVFFRVTPFDEGSAAALPEPTRATLPLLPRANYPFPGHVPLLAGSVRAASGGAVAAALVEGFEPFDDMETQKKRTRVLADAAGLFRLPLRWGNAKHPTVVAAADPATKKRGSVQLAFPYDLSKPKTITIPTL